MMSGLSHELEEVLDDLRLGRIELSQRVLDLVFRAVELYGQILTVERGSGADPTLDVEALLVALGQVSHRGRAGGASPVAQYELDPGLLGVLTEYEEHRLRTNIQNGMSLYRLRVQFPLATIDSALDELKAKARPHGEIITYLPTGGGSRRGRDRARDPHGEQERVDLLAAAISRARKLAIEEVAATTDRTRAHVAAATASGLRCSPSGAPEAFFTRAAHASARRATAGSPRSPPSAHRSAREVSLRSVTQTVRVDIRKLDHLMNIVGELAIVRTALMAVADRLRGRVEMRPLMQELLRLHRSFERHLGQMQGGILEVRMVPLGQAFDKLARVVRQISREHDKQVNLVITGAETEIDKLIVEELSDPLMHMIRNAIDHGIEPRDERLRVGKPPIGTIALNAFQKGNHVVIEVEDDGRGMDPTALAAVALKTRRAHRGRGARHLAARRAHAGLPAGLHDARDGDRPLGSRRRHGRREDEHRQARRRRRHLERGRHRHEDDDHAADHARDHQRALRRGRGSHVRDAARERRRGDRLRHARDANVRRTRGDDRARGDASAVPISRDSSDTRPRSPPPHGFVVVTSVGNRRVGFVVDGLIGQQDIVIKALGRTLRTTRGFAGATELGDQRVALVLDVGALVDDAFMSHDVFKAAQLDGRLPA